MKRSDLQIMAEAKLTDAQALFQAGKYSSAYYLAGYAVEFGLKACIARQVVAETIPDKDFVKDLYTHDLPKLLGLAGLKKQLEDDGNDDRELKTFWAIAKDWSEQSRYEVKLEGDAHYMIEAITNPTHGVMQWIKKHW